MATIPDSCDATGRAAAVSGVAACYRLADAWVLVLRGEIDLANIAPVRELVDRVVRQHPGPLLFDLGPVTFCDSCTLNLLLRARRRTAVGVVGPTPAVVRLLAAGGGGLLPVFGTLAAAVRALARSSATGEAEADADAGAGAEDGVRAGVRAAVGVDTEADADAGIGVSAGEGGGPRVRRPGPVVPAEAWSPLSGADGRAGRDTVPGEPAGRPSARWAAAPEPGAPARPAPVDAGPAAARPPHEREAGER